eukprot:ANDGO_08191.mRNA.1 hypothetical protein
MSVDATHSALRSLPKDAKKLVADLLVKLSETVRENQQLVQKHASDKSFWDAERESMRTEMLRMQEQASLELETRKKEIDSQKEKFQEAVRLVKTYQGRVEELLSHTETLYEEKLTLTAHLSSTQQLLQNLQMEHSKCLSRLAEVEAELDKDRHHYRVLELAREKTRQILLGSTTNSSASNASVSATSSQSVLPVLDHPRTRELDEQQPTAIATVVESSRPRQPAASHFSGSSSNFSCSSGTMQPAPQVQARRNLAFEENPATGTRDWRSMLDKYLDSSPQKQQSQAPGSLHASIIADSENRNNSLEYSPVSKSDVEFASPVRTNMHVFQQSPDANDKVVVDEELVDLMSLLDKDAFLEKRYNESPVKKTSVAQSPGFPRDLRSSQKKIEDEIQDILDALNG